MIIKALPVILLATAFVTSAVRAGEATGYTMEDVTACSKDAVRLCRDKLADLSAIEACMRARYDELSPKCQARFSR